MAAFPRACCCCSAVGVRVLFSLDGRGGEAAGWMGSQTGRGGVFPRAGGCLYCVLKVRIARIEGWGYVGGVGAEVSVGALRRGNASTRGLRHWKCSRSRRARKPA